MSQYLQFRSWLRTSSAAEKQLVVAVTVIVIGLIAWALVPTDHPAGTSVVSSGAGAVASGGQVASGGSTASPGSGQGSAPASGQGSGQGSVATSGGGGPVRTVVAPTGVSSASTGAITGTSAGSSGATCGTLTSSDTGVTPTQIKVADILLNLAGAIGNSAVGQPSPQTQQQMAQAVVDDINAHGGVACRKLVVTYYQANPIDSTSTQNICLQIAQAGLFAVIGGFAFPQGANDCLAQHKIPVVGNIAPTPGEARTYYPYLMSGTPDPVEDYKTSVLGLRDRGWFTAAQGFKKIAILEDDCAPEINDGVYHDLIEAGLTPDQITKNTFSCPSGGFASPSDMGNFATQDNLNHVTNVVVVTGGGSFKEYSNSAQGQGYKPRYLVSNYQGFLVTATGGTGPDPNNFDGTIVTTLSKYGETDTPGLALDPATRACIALFARHGLPSSYITGSYLGAGNCNLFEIFAAAAAHDAGLTKARLATGLGQIGRFNEAYPAADAIYTTPGPTTPVKVSGGDWWWTIQFRASCTCWMVIDPTTHPAY